MSVGRIKVSEVVAAIRAVKSSAFEAAAGATEDDLRRLTARLGYPLPSAYLDFLACMGRSSGNIRIDDMFDFSMQTMHEVLDDLDSPPRPLYPVAYKAAGDGASLLCLDLDDPDDDPAMYAVFSPEDAKHPECLWAERFSGWLANRLVSRAIIEQSRYVVDIRPELTDDYFSWAFATDVNASVLGALSDMGFHLFHPGCMVYERANGQYVSYLRSPGRYGFLLRTGALTPVLGRELLNGLREVITTGLTAEGR